MKQVLTVIMCCIFLSVFAGCQVPSRNLEVIIEGDGRFPGFLAGRWKADGINAWEFEFEPDGTISYAVIMPGFAKLLPGQEKRIVGRGGAKGIYKAGDWKVIYDHEDRELTVKVVTDYFYQEIKEGALEGDSVDYLIGPISEDGKTWIADWSSSGKYIAIKNVKTDPEKIEMSNVVDPEFRSTLVFNKSEE